MTRPPPSHPWRHPIRFVLAGLAALLLATGCGKSPAAPKVFPPLAAIVLSPDTLVVRVGQSLAFTATALDSSSLEVSGVPFVWTSDDPTAVIISVNSVGRVTGRGEGFARVFAEAGGVRDSSVVRVVPDRDGWFLQISNANGANLNGVFFLPDGRTGWAVGAAGKILKTVDAGAQWTVQVSGTHFTLNGAWFTSASDGWAVGNGGTVLRTATGGAQWSRVDAGANEALMDIQFGNDSLGWVVGSNGVAMRTQNRGATWQRLFPTTFTLHSVSFAGTQHGWAVGDNGTIVGTHNAGASWFVVQPSVTSLALRAVWRRSEPLAFAAGMQGAAPRTFVQDTTRWQLMTAGAANQLEGLHFPTDATGFAVGWNGVGAVLRTDDAGATWTAQVANTQFRLNDVFFVDTERGWAVGENGTILHTGSGGQ